MKRPGARPQKRTGARPHKSHAAKMSARSKPQRPRPDFAKRIDPTRESMDRMLREGGVSLERDQLERLWTFHGLLRGRNQDRDLTRIIGFENTVIKHYLDSMVVGNFVRLPSPLLDIGTGAGFPGIPLKIRYPELELILAEPRPRRVAFLNEVIQRLSLKNVKVFEHRVVSASFKQPVAGVITRALETMDKTIQRTTAALQQGGTLIFLKGPGADAELKETLKRFNEDIKLRMDQEYRLGKTSNQRRLIVFERPPSR